MESLTRLVTESLARHGFDRPVDYRRLQWSRWFRCESHHSLLVVPSKPGVFALAEEIMDIGSNAAHVGAGDSPAKRTMSEAQGSSPAKSSEADSRKPEAPPRRMLAVAQFFEDDDMAFVLDRMLSRQNPMSSRMTSGRYFARFVVIEDATQRRSICNALNQWIVNSAEKATGIGSHFASSLELTPEDGVENVARALSPASADTTDIHVATAASAVPRSEASGPRSGPGFSRPYSSSTTPQLDSGAATNIHCPTALPSGF